MQHVQCPTIQRSALLCLRTVKNSAPSQNPDRFANTQVSLQSCSNRFSCLGHPSVHFKLFKSAFPTFPDRCFQYIVLIKKVFKTDIFLPWAPKCSFQAFQISISDISRQICPPPCLRVVAILAQSHRNHATRAAVPTCAESGNRAHSRRAAGSPGLAGPDRPPAHVLPVQCLLLHQVCLGGPHRVELQAQRTRSRPPKSA